MAYRADAVVVGAGLSGLVAANELVAAGRSVIVLDQEPESNLGGQAHWSFGGLFFVDSPEQRRLGVRDSVELARSDWMGTAGFDRNEDAWPGKWANAFVEFAAADARPWLRSLGLRWFPLVGWAERGGYFSEGPGNSVPRFHVTWGTGPGVVEPFVRAARAAESAGNLQFLFRHRASDIIMSGGRAAGVRGGVLESSSEVRGKPTTRTVIADFEVHSDAVIVTSGGIGANHDLVRRFWPESAGASPVRLLQGVPDYVDGSMLEPVERVGGHLINRDRMWHYPEGLLNYAPIWSRHAIRILSGPTPLWIDATGRRLPVPLYPGYDTLGALRFILSSGHDYSWFVLNERVIRKEFALSGSEQNPDLTGGSLLTVVRQRFSGRRPAPVTAFMERGTDFVVGESVADLSDGMNRLVGSPLIRAADLEKTIRDRDLQLSNNYGKDAQIAAIRSARGYTGDRLSRVTRLHKLLEPAAGPLIAVRLSILTRKTLGGIETDLSGRVIASASGEPIPGLFAAGEASGFGGGGMHGYRALEGTFLLGCIFSGRSAGRCAAS